MNGDSYRLKQSSRRGGIPLDGAAQNQATAETVDPATGEITEA